MLVGAHFARSLLAASRRLTSIRVVRMECDTRCILHIVRSMYSDAKDEGTHRMRDPPG